MSGVEPWPPTRYTPPLGPESASLFGRYQEAFRVAWRTARGYRLEPWQEELLRAVTEIDPATGHLRFRQALISLGRQNGKSEVMAALGLLFMLAKPAAYVVGIASSAEQARLVYNRACSVVMGVPGLRKRFTQITDTRGLGTVTGGRWELKAAKSAALQGIPIDLGAVDEVHIVKPQLWTDLLNGTGGRPDCLVVGITTAGDDSSELLKRLYDLDAPSFGLFVWEAPEPSVPEDDETLADYLRAANPSIASGRIDVATVIEDVRAMPPADAIRYRLNRFVAGSDSGFMRPPLWEACRVAASEMVRGPGAVLAIDRTPDWRFASIVAAWTLPDGTVQTELVRVIPNPTTESIADACQDLYRHAPAVYAVDARQLGALDGELKRRGLPTRRIGFGDLMSAASRMYALAATRRLQHPGDETLARQLRGTVRKNVGDLYRLAKADAAAQIDAVVATSVAVYLAETTKPAEIQIF